MLIVKASQVLYAERLDTNYHCCESQEPVLSMFPAHTNLQLFLSFFTGSVPWLRRGWSGSNWVVFLQRLMLGLVVPPLMVGR